MTNQYSVRGISFLTPPGWKAREVDDFIEILPPESEGALHISFLEKENESAPNEDEAHTLIAEFAKNNRLVTSDDVSTSLLRDEARGFGSFRPRNGSDDVPEIWIVASVVWPDRALQISYCTDTLGSRTRAAVVSLIETIRRSR